MRDCSTPGSRLFQLASNLAPLTFASSGLKRDLSISLDPLSVTLSKRRRVLLLTLAARACYLFTNKEENGWRSPVCNTVFVSRFMVEPAEIYANVMPEPEERAEKKWRVIEQRSREETSLGCGHHWNFRGDSWKWTRSFSKISCNY